MGGGAPQRDIATTTSYIAGFLGSIGWWCWIDGAPRLRFGCCVLAAAAAAASQPPPLTPLGSTQAW